MIVIDLTGGIASGKSSITQALAARGATIIDADKVGPGTRPTAHPTPHVTPWNNC